MGALAYRTRHAPHATIRPMEPDDAAAFIELRRTIAEEKLYFASAADELEIDVGREAERIVHDREDAGTVRLVVETRRAIVGWAAFRRGRLRRTAHVARLEIGVAAAERGHGFGGALLDRLIAHAVVSPGLEQLLAEVQAGNVRALSLFAGRGFTAQTIHDRALKLGPGIYQDVWGLGFSLFSLLGASDQDAAGSQPTARPSCR